MLCFHLSAITKMQMDISVGMTRTELVFARKAELAASGQSLDGHRVN